MSAKNINIVILSGEVAWVKMKYTSTKKIYISFAIKQPVITFEDGVVVSRSYDYYFCNCYEEYIWKHERIKEGTFVTAQGRIAPFKTVENRVSFSIVIEKLDVHGLRENKEQVSGAGNKKNALRAETVQAKEDVAV